MELSQVRRLGRGLQTREAACAKAWRRGGAWRVPGRTQARGWGHSTNSTREEGSSEAGKAEPEARALEPGDMQSSTLLGRRIWRCTQGQSGVRAAGGEWKGCRFGAGA